jgi:hypothetical protein
MMNNPPLVRLLSIAAAQQKLAHKLMSAGRPIGGKSGRHVSRIVGRLRMVM